MTEINTIKSAKELGKKGGCRYIYLVCTECGSYRWVRIRETKKPSFTGLCRVCRTREMGRADMRRNVPAGPSHSSWKGGRLTPKSGYILIKLLPDDFFYPMVNIKGYVFEHRLVMAKHLGRCLHRWELVHHKNGVKDENRIENLQLVSEDRHKQITILECKIKYLQIKIKELKLALKNNH